MSKFNVFHHVDGNFLGNIEECRDFQRNYTLAASVEARSLDDAFRLTNTIDAPWWENEGVDRGTLIGGARSTSVGDVIEDVENHELYMCSMIGWVAL
jgi:hypothetical protein